ncbi:hypothetical protein [Vibrio sp. ED002]|uniref:hypothetical protein n=1 Tax=Vibrio sp. ED002 TaxID=2785123 RepID=UPI0024B0ACC6|nr:hypothetical protein [Vibrio sp. ED002]
MRIIFSLSYLSLIIPEAMLNKAIGALIDINAITPIEAEFEYSTSNSIIEVLKNHIEKLPIILLQMASLYFLLCCKGVINKQSFIWYSLNTDLLRSPRVYAEGTFSVSRLT